MRVFDDIVEDERWLIVFFLVDYRLFFVLKILEFRGIGFMYVLVVIIFV